MTCKTTLEMKEGYVQCTCEGKLDGTVLLDLARDSLSHRSERKISGLLADVRMATTDMSMFDAIRFGEDLAEMAPLCTRGRTAIVHSEQGEAASRLFETALVNRSFTVRLFRDIEAAEEWLTYMNEQERKARR